MTDENQNDATNTNKDKDPWTSNALRKLRGKKNYDDSENWEREVLADLALGALKEQRRARRWGVFFKLLMLAYLLVVLVLAFGSKNNGVTGVGGDHTAVIEVRGVIADDADASADRIVSSLRKAFEDKHTKGVIIRINSPGGSPVQAGYINDEIYRLKDKYPNTPVYAVVTDVCASGGYYIAVAADEIYADKASIVVSIGVVMSGFGFTDAMDKLGVERRLLTAGESKGFLDPFSPQKDADVDHVQAMLGNIHTQFIDIVKQGRGDRLQDDPSLFTGLVWTGEQSVELGLVDGLASTSYVAREIIGVEKTVDFSYQPDPFERFAERLGVVMAETFARVAGIEHSQLR